MLKRLISSAVLIVALIAAPSVLAKGSGHSRGHGKGGGHAGGHAKASGPKPVHVKGHTKKDGTHVAPHDRSAPTRSSEPKPEKAATAKSSKAVATATARDERGHIKRSEQMKRTFMKETGYPHGRPGYMRTLSARLSA